MRTPFHCFLLAGVLPAAMLLSFARQRPASSCPAMRQPVALVFVDSGKTVLVANRRSGSLSIIDVATARTVAEHDVGRGLADLAVLQEGRDCWPSMKHRMSSCSWTITIVKLSGCSIGCKVSPDPVRLAVLGDGASCAVASRWSRRLTFVSITKGPTGEDTAIAAIGDLDLPFCPGELASLGRRLETGGRGRLRRAAWR